MPAPKAKKIEKVFTEFGNKRTDNYYWLNDRKNPEVIAYLEEENIYTTEVMKDTEDLQEELFTEIVGRIKQTDMSVPYRLKGYEYYTRYESEKEYPIYCRKILADDAEEEIMLDGNAMAGGYAFFHIGGWEVSPNNQLLAYSVDTVSRRKYTIHFKNLETGEILKDKLPNTSGDFAWANDNKTLFYTVRDKALRPCKIYKHILDTDPKHDKLIFHEKDNTFYTHVYKTKSGEFIVIGSESTLTSEYRILDASIPDGEFRVFQKRKRGHEYDISHQGGRWLIRTNDGALNFKLMEAPENNTEMVNWTEVIPASKDVLIESVTVFSEFFVAEERINGLPVLRIFNTKNKTDHCLAFEEPDYYAYTKSNPDYESTKLRYAFTSLKTPETIFDYDMIAHQKLFLKQQEVLGGYDPDNYCTERIYADVRDGTKVPVSIVYSSDFKKDGTRPLFLYGYGSYGINMESTFRSSRLSLLDRGFVYAIAHVRGGEEMGRKWYEDGKLLKKKNTFYDFIDCGSFLVENKFCAKDRLFAGGGSAGGLLVGAAINIAPELFAGVVAAVPFVDVVTTMLDDSIPLTTHEYDEWGNPNIKEYYYYMLSYSPYDQVKTGTYPHMLVTAGLHDSQVQYWEPAKWVAKLRELKTDNHLLLLHTSMEFGHGGASGRFEFYRDTALEYAFMLKLIENGS